MIKDQFHLEGMRKLCFSKVPVGIKFTGKSLSVNYLFVAYLEQ